MLHPLDNIDEIIIHTMQQSVNQSSGKSNISEISIPEYRSCIGIYTPKSIDDRLAIVTTFQRYAKIETKRFLNSINQLQCMHRPIITIPEPKKRSRFPFSPF